MTRFAEQRGIAGLLAIVLTVACSSAGAPADTLSVKITQETKAAPVQADLGTAVPVVYRLEVTNALDEPVTLIGINLETVGDAGGYVMRRARHEFNRAVPAGTTTSLQIRAWVQPMQIDNRFEINAPVTLRGTARFDTGDGTRVVQFGGRVN